MNKIIFLAHDFPPTKGGISSFLYELVRHLPPKDVVVIGLPTPGWEAFDAKQDFKIIRLRIPSTWSASSAQFKFLAPYYYKELVKIIGTGYILCGTAHHSMMLPSWLLKATRNIPFGVFGYGLDLLRPQKRIYKPIFNLLVKSADAVFVISRRTSNIAMDIVGAKPEKIHTIHPPVNLDLSRKVSPDAIRSALCLENKKCILSVGNLVERKGHDMVIRALPEIINKVPNVHYIVIGRGSNENHLRKLARDLNIESYITFAGFIPDDDLGSYYALCDVFVMISREIPEKGDIEGFGIVYLEANLFGKPVVAGRSGGVSDAVLNGQTGLMVNPNDPMDVANTVTRLLLDPDLAHRLGAMGRSRVLEEFLGQSAVQKLQDVVVLKLH